MLTTAFFIVVLSVAFFVILSVVFFIVMLSLAFFVIVSVIMPSIAAAIDKHKRSKIVISLSSYRCLTFESLIDFFVHDREDFRCSPSACTLKLFKVVINSVS